MSWKNFIVCGGLVCLLASPAWADPTLRVVDGGLSGGGGRLFNVFVTPDPALYDLPLGGPFTASSMAVEIGFEALGASIVDATTTNQWEDDQAAPLGNTGLNPYTSTVDTGIVIDGAGANVFAALGSTSGPGPNPDPLGDIAGETLVMTIELDGAIGLLEMSSSILAQAEQEFVVTEGFGNAPLYPTTSSRFGVVGDFDLDGDVDGIDLGPFAGQFCGSVAGCAPASFADFDGDTDVDGVDLGPFSARFGLSAPGAPIPGAGAGSAVVPEPTSITLFLFGLAACGSLFRRRKR